MWKAPPRTAHATTNTAARTAVSASHAVVAAMHAALRADRRQRCQRHPLEACPVRAVPAALPPTMHAALCRSQGLPAAYAAVTEH